MGFIRKNKHKKKIHDIPSTLACAYSLVEIKHLNYPVILFMHSPFDKRNKFVIELTFCAYKICLYAKINSTAGLKLNKKVLYIHIQKKS